MTGEFSIAAHAIVYLNHRGTTIKSGELAKNICTNPARVRKVLSKLVQHGIVLVKEGAEGGYSFHRDPRAITLCDLLDALGEQPISPLYHTGDHDLPCLVASGMAGVMDGIVSALNAVSREKLKGITIADLDFQIFGQK